MVVNEILFHWSHQETMAAHSCMSAKQKLARGTKSLRSR
jgi:hypothetical protein